MLNTSNYGTLFNKYCKLIQRNSHQNISSGFIEEIKPRKAHRVMMILLVFSYFIVRAMSPFQL